MLYDIDKVEIVNNDITLITKDGHRIPINTTKIHAMQVYENHAQITYNNGESEYISYRNIPNSTTNAKIIEVDFSKPLENSPISVEALIHLSCSKCKANLVVNTEKDSIALIYKCQKFTRHICRTCVAVSLDKLFGLNFNAEIEKDLYG